MRKFIGILLLAALTGCVSQTSTPVRPVVVKVLDKESGKPLQGMKVYYSLHTKVFQKYIFFVIPSTEPDIGPKIAYKASRITDKDGKVLFHADDFMLPGNEHFQIESIIVNINANMASKEAQISKRILGDYYAQGKIRRDGPVDNIDIVEQYFSESRKERDEVLFRPNAKYSGAIIKSRARPPYGEGDENGWFQADEHITEKFNGNSLTKEKDVITVYLKRI